MMNVISDYGAKIAGKGAVGPMRIAMTGITAMTTLGLLKLNLQGKGLTETVKSLWRRDP